MRIGIPKEIKNRERRIAVVPEGAAALSESGHDVCIEAGAGEGSGFSDSDYMAAGARIVQPDEAWAAEMVVKVKEPLAIEYPHLRPGLLLFTYLHLAAVPELVPVLLEQRVRAIGYETVQMDNGPLPLLAPMSRVAGRVAAQMGASLLQAENGTPFPGKGKLMGGMDGVPPARVVILGGGNAGRNAAQVAAGMGGKVCVLDANPACVDALNRNADGHIRAERFSREILQRELADCDLLIGATLVAGEHAARLLNAELLATMQGGVFIDIAIDQGGISDTSRPTSYAEPVYVEAGVLHCCLPNMPACVPLSATRALTHATFPFLKILADQGGDSAVREESESGRALARGVNTWDGHLTHAGVAHALDRARTPLKEALED